MLIRMFCLKLTKSYKGLRHERLSCAHMKSYNLSSSQQDTQPLGHLALAHADMEELPMKKLSFSFKGSNNKTVVTDTSQGHVKSLLLGQGVYKAYRQLGCDNPPVWQSLEKVVFAEGGHYILATIKTTL